MPDSQNLFQVFRRHFPADGNRIALQAAAGAGPSYRYVDLVEESGRWANFLTAQGLQAGDRVSVQIDKCSQGVALYLGCLRAGLIYHPLNTAYRRSELDYFLDNAEPGAAICSQAYSETLASLAAARNIGRCFVLGPALFDRVGECAAEFATLDCGADDIAALLYSSGTTGRPKGIMLSHGNLAANATALAAAWGFSEGDTLLHALPMFHVHGLFVALGCALISGAKMLYLAKFDAGEVIERLPEATVMMGVPTYYTRLLAQPRFSRQDCRNMRLFICGSAPLLAATFTQFERRSGHTILERYGMTETNMNTSNPLHGRRKAGSVGPPLPGVEVRVVGPQGEALAVAEVGDVQVRGANVFKGYWRMPEKTREDFTADGFFNTGDKGLIDSDGYLAIVGRSKDMVISGGLNIYPKEVELVIDELEDICESAVIGVPHPDFGEAVVAVVVPQSGTDIDASRLLTRLKGQLANYKIPKKIVCVTQLPRNAMGKVQKNLLRETYQGLFTA